MKTAKSFLSRRLSKTPLDANSPQYKSPQAPHHQSPNFLCSLRNRRLKNRNISPELAAQVVKSYIIPMFDQKIRSRTCKSRKEHRGITVDISEPKGIVTEELCLSSKLYERLKKYEEKNHELEAQCKTVLQKKVAHNDEEHLKIMLLNSEANCISLIAQIKELIKEKDENRAKNVFLLHERNKYKELFEKTFEEVMRLKEKLSIEEQNLDIR